jgi:hypothetical protein
VTPSGDFRAGSGIPAATASSATDGAIELVLMPFVGSVGEFVDPDTGGNYAIDLAAGQRLAVAFGASLVSGENVKITDYYDVVMSVTAGGDTATLSLVSSSTPSGYTWTDGASYNIVDSAGDAATVQNVTRLNFLVPALLPPAALDPGLSVWTLEAVRRGSGEITTLTINVTTTAV